ncbi:hypothetical protein AVEN_141087-1 [Araneus ventricosus]|uniref:Uncharacterized protein n=1 Tax=Araneus ventricosus TaxID=182803 RepID=A0A4Y2SHW8_ARAVE|nr:hypothetical protein AVEN_141087-1 [Araneus ventricosus]
MRIRSCSVGVFAEDEYEDHIHKGILAARVPEWWGRLQTVQRTNGVPEIPPMTIYFKWRNSSLCSRLRIPRKSNIKNIVGWFVETPNANHVVGSEAGYTKHPCLLCLWDSRARYLHWTKTDWSHRAALTPGERNVINITLVPPEKVLLPSIHIKLELLKQFIKSLPKGGECFRYLCSKFPKLSEAKLKEGVFTSPDIQKLLSDSFFSETKGTKKKKRRTLLRM